jgi:hypothetical protein
MAPFRCLREKVHASLSAHLILGDVAGRRQVAWALNGLVSWLFPGMLGALARAGGRGARDYSRVTQTGKVVR